MKKLSLVLTFLVITIFLNGCLTFKSVRYEVMKNGGDAGTVVVEIYDIRTDAKDNEELEADKEYLFNFALESQQFVDDMKNEGKNIIHREMYKSEGKLNARILYKYDTINSVENIQYEKPYFYLTVNPTDSILSTNGQIISTGEYKRIIWDDSHSTLKFEMMREESMDGNLRSMSEFYINE